MKRILITVAWLAASLMATTLERLTVDQMIAQSNLIVRAKVVDKSSFLKGSLIYTRYRVQVAETLKGNAGSSVEVAIPGGIQGRTQQTIAGAPQPVPGQEYVFFVWTGRNGINQIIGLSQGLFDLKVDAQGKLLMTRGEADVPMVDAQGRRVVDRPVTLSFREFSDRMRREGAAR